MKINRQQHFSRLSQPAKERLKMVAVERSKTWLVWPPDALEALVVRSLSRFCTAHNLDRANLHKVARGLRDHHKGYQARWLG